MNNYKKKVAIIIVISILLSFIPLITNKTQANQSIKIGDYIQFGSYYDEPILWRVINIDKKGDPLLFSEYTLTTKAFDAAGDNHLNRTAKTSESNVWEMSTIRQWLNSSDRSISWLRNPPSIENLRGGTNPYDKEKGFLADGNFTSIERNMIKPSTHKVLLPEEYIDKREGGREGHEYNSEVDDVVQNYENSWYKNITDKVFLLSIKEFKEYVYDRDWGYELPTNPTKHCTPSPIGYWFRTPSVNFLKGHVRSYKDTDYGNLVDRGIYAEMPTASRIGVKPALYLNLSGVTLKSGSGTSTNPYIITGKQSQINISTDYKTAYHKYLQQFSKNNITKDGYQIHGKNAVLIDISGNGIPELVTFDFYNDGHDGDSKSGLATIKVLTFSNNEVKILGEHYYVNLRNLVLHPAEIYLAEDNYNGNKFILMHSSNGGLDADQRNYVQIIRFNEYRSEEVLKFLDIWVDNSSFNIEDTFEFLVDGNEVKEDYYYRKLDEFNKSLSKTPIKPIDLTETKIREILESDIDGQIQNLDLLRLLLVEGSRTFLDLNISGPNIKFEYKVNDPSIATIRSNGEIIGLREGETIIAVTIRHGAKASEIEIPVTVKPKIVFDYKSILTTRDKSGLLKILKDTINSLDTFYYEDNSTLMELVNFSNFMIRNASKGTIDAKKNVTVLSADNLKPLANNVQAIVNEINNLFITNNINLQRQLTSTVRFDVKKLNLNKPVHLVLNNSMLEALNNVDAIQVGLDLAEITLNASELNVELKDKQELRIEVRRKKDSKGFAYELFFSDEKGQAIPRLERNITVSLPVQNLNHEYSTVFMNDGIRTEQIGGQYDPNTNMISFQTRTMGEYYILENKTDFKDIGHLTDEEQQAIIFMTSRGFISGRDNENFEPNAEITRGEFTSLLVRTFYALDRSLAPSFTDITKDDWYYDYVASSEKEGIVLGYPDATFRGENIVTKEQSVAVATRALHEKKKYLYPENPENYLPFIDNHEIQTWAKGEVALAYRETLIDIPEDRLFRPQSAMTRADAVLLVHRLFQLLYETTPTALPTEGRAPFSGPIPIAVGGMAAIGALAGFYLKRFYVK
ncbi:S-layer homology domain-containing protein [Serpentinicella alkaliphila]|uniref:S-layer family protein n=1 Tax=Serpentinicella alkaliphila TaxID=1734049 RepID=A0A4R2TL41_9FIRM|nr:S-layer homology domain-containing protein [Serpentinicella alkaliphila]QUH25553.1 S-layer homology domain-containing protein [Serpentinicella alkaliphila]TCQ01905.1 S-layer family protein [Serpentinicella alkaliphila]